jgi:hypothetical protein
MRVLAGAARLLTLIQSGERAARLLAHGPRVDRLARRVLGFPGIVAASSALMNIS